MHRDHTFLHLLEERNRIEAADDRVGRVVLDAEVIAVADPEAAIGAIEAAGGSVTGLLVDYHLDRGNGVAAIREIRRRFGENIPAILITADRSPNVRAAAREENIAILNKPVKPASLRALLGQWRAQQMVAAE